MLWIPILACRATEPSPGRGPTAPTAPTAAPSPTADTGGAPDGGSGHTGGVPADSAPAAFSCDDLPDRPLSVTSVDIETTEDFDFDAEARLVYADWYGNLIAVDDQARQTVLSPGNSDTDARGIQVLSTGEILVNYIWSNRIVKVDPATGARQDYLVGIQGPNALEVGDGDVVYASETSTGRIWQYDPASETRQVIASGFTYPNGLALSPDQLTLYISDDLNGIFSIQRATVDEPWGEPTRVFEPAPGEAYDAMETDACGNLYSIQFYSGKLYRYSPSTGTATMLVDLNDPWSLLWNAIRWGSNRGGWRRDTLYVTSRNRIFAVELGVNGRDQPVDLAP